MFAAALRPWVIVAHGDFVGLRRAWGRVRWKMLAIVVFTGSSTILMAFLGVAALNVLVRREGPNVVEKQIDTLVQASRTMAPAFLDHADACNGQGTDSRELKPLLAYMHEAFPQARISLAVNGSGHVDRPHWLVGNSFAGLIVDHGQVEILDLAEKQNGACEATASFSMPLGAELAKRLSSEDGTEVIAVSPKLFRVHARNQRVFRTIEGNFVPGLHRPAAVVLTVRNWETGALEDWSIYQARSTYARTFHDVAELGRQKANWVWLLAAIAVGIVLIDAAGVWMCVRLSSNVAVAIDDLSSAARQIAVGNFAWRTPVRTQDQLGDLSGSFNEMAIALERLHKEEAAKLQIESELEVARRVQDHLYPRVTPRLHGATVSARTLAARAVGGDLYDFFELGQELLGILCADMSGKGVPAALMMANLQAIARGHADAGPPAQFVETLNAQLTGRFGDNRYASLLWARFNSRTRILTYVNAGHPPPILIRSTGKIERLDANGLPIGMFTSSRYTAADVQMQPGSRVVMFTDGLTDACNALEEEFGDERLVECCRRIGPGTDAEGVAERLMQAVAEWSAGTEPTDDTTVVVLAVD